MEIVAESVPFPAYHNGKCSAENRDKWGRKKAPPMNEREVIAWDMEGISLSGVTAPQHPVLFGCSVETHRALVGWKLRGWDMLHHIIDVGKRHPHAIHVGFGFRYDGNMLLQDFPRGFVKHLYQNGSARYHDEQGREWRFTWRPGKSFMVSRYDSPGKKTTVNIYDYSSFFGGANFLNTAEQLLKDSLTDDDRDVIAHGKAARGSQSWDDMPEIRYYWEREIGLIQRVFERFRDVMFQAGFSLKDWYGPGALANYINQSRGIKEHLTGAQVTSGEMPLAVHEASKHAFSGGRFELFKAGRHQGPIYAIDINSAYPYALTGVPSLAPENGFWQHVENPNRIARFGVYRISFKAPNSGPIEYRPMPLFYRDPRGMVSYPNRVHGWYWSPEAQMVNGLRGATIHEGWEWVQTTEVYPWEFLREMYATRKRLGKDNLLSLPFKLGPNSLYGKYAQTVGWDRKKRLPPRSHALAVAGWVTSYCRSMLWQVIRQIPDDVIAVETDSVFTTVDPRTLNIRIGDELGEWGYTEYEELVYIQSGMYHTRTNGEWSGTRSRGMGRAEYTIGAVRDYLTQLVPGEEWPELTITTKPRFIGAGAALANELTFKKRHCAWIPQTRMISFGSTGKRRLFPAASPEFQEGVTPWDKPYRLAVSTTSDGEMLSAARRLPWEVEQTEEVEEIRKRLDVEAEQISRA